MLPCPAVAQLPSLIRSVGIFLSSSVMESIGPLAGTVRSKSKQALLLWLDGVREACCLHRVIIYSLRSKQLAIRTGQCFLLNGFIFLGRYSVESSRRHYYCKRKKTGFQLHCAP
ncbi:hypothetical protein HAX54_016759 [Datura stramonium]|uniref:Secreted protein n=1 Tax=Datura stramonium TaxID=4076 RepID=A0ABS8UJN1_DATST|nr:hypothetical protein [Datura stramonium]